MKSNHQFISVIAIAMLGSGIVASFILWFAVTASSTAGLARPVVPVLAPIIVSMVAFVCLYSGYLKKYLFPAGELLEKNPTPAVPEQSTSASAVSVALSPNSRGIILEVPSVPEMTSQQIKALIENAADVICLLDIDGKLLQVNPASVAVWGYKPEELIGKNLKEFLESDEDIKATLQALLGADKSVDQLHFDNRFRRKQGDIVDMSWSAHWSVSDNGLFCVAHNITERKRAEQLIRESEQRVRGILENLPAGVVLINRSGCLEFMNETACRLSGYSKSMDFSELRAPALLSFCKEPFFMKQLEPLVNDEKSQGLECFITRQTGDRFPAEASVSFIKIENEQSGLVIFLDATVKHELERAKREFVAMVSHDLRSPLTSISMILSYLASGNAGELTPKGLDFAQRSKKECERLMSMIKDLLDLEKMKAGKFSMSKTETDLVELVKAAVGTLDRSQVSEGVKYSIVCPEKLLCNCDGARIIQVLVNLLDNATKYSAAGQEVKVEAEEKESEFVVSISNKGRPIPEEKLATIFEKFEQVDESDSRERKGTGLGLAICKTIVEQHDGRIWVSSSTSKETKFSISLPKTDAVGIEVEKI